MDFAAMDEADLVQHAQAGAREAFDAIMQRSSQRLFRIARGLVHNDAEAEDIVQETWVRAFTHLDTFRGEAGIFTWLTPIAINEANSRRRKRRENVGLEVVEAKQTRGAHEVMFPHTDATMTPELNVARMQVRRLLESAIDDLPDDARVVFIMRDIEGCSTAETAATLGVREETIRTRLHRARRLLRAALSGQLGVNIAEAFLFKGPRCDQVRGRVFARLLDYS